VPCLTRAGAIDSIVEPRRGDSRPYGRERDDGVLSIASGLFHSIYPGSSKPVAADLVTLDKDPLKVAQSTIEDIKVIAMIKEGKMVFPATQVAHTP